MKLTMGLPLLAGSLLLCLGAASGHAQPPADPVAWQAKVKKFYEELREKDRRVAIERVEHPLQPSDLVDAGLQCLEQDLARATTLHDTDGLATCLKLLEQFWCQAVAYHDGDAINRIEADDFVCTDTSGALTHKSDDLEAAKSSALALTEFKLDEIKVNLYGDTAVLTGKTSFSGTANDQPFASSYRWTDVFVQRDGHWQVVASQATNIASPAEGKKTGE